MKKIMLACILLSTSLFSYDIEKVKVEVENHSSRITEKTHPELYSMIKDAATNLQMELPVVMRVYQTRSFFDLNAFATDYKGIYLGKELIDTAKSADDIYAIICHELVHIKHQHAIKMLLALSATIGVIGTLWLSNCGLEKTNLFKDKLKDYPRIKDLICNTIVQIGFISLLPITLKLSRSFEKDADITAVKEGKANPANLIGGLKTIKEKTSLILNTFKDQCEAYGYMPVYKFIKKTFSSHPSMKEREAYLQELAVS